MRNRTNKDDPRLGQFFPRNQNVFRYHGLPVVLKSGADAGNWRPALLVSALSLVIIGMLAYILHLGDGLVYILLLVDGVIATLVWNRVLGRRH